MDFYIHTKNYKCNLFTESDIKINSDQINKINIKYITGLTISKKKDSKIYRYDDTLTLGLGKFLSRFSSRNYLLSFSFKDDRYYNLHYENLFIEFYFKNESDCESLKNEIEKGKNQIFSNKQKLIRQEKKEQSKLYIEQKKQENERLKKLKVFKNKIFSELDKDGNGIIDVIEGNDDFMKLFRKHQLLIKEFDKNYVNNLVKISNYLKIKRKNIQQIFVQIRKTKNQTELENYVGLLKNQIHTYESVFYHSLQLINSIVQDDFITVNEIYEEFDKLKMFKSDHEKEVSEKLSDIKDGLSDLMYSIDSMERNIVGGLNELTYITSDGFSNLNNSLVKELKSVQSTIGFNNLLTGIQTYQMYKINKNTRSLRS